jgi:polyisoprenoid-binding protein YceI
MKLVILLLILSLQKNVPIVYTPIDQSSSVTFKISNLGFSVPGSFKGLKGTISFDPNNLQLSQFDVTVDAGTVNTDNNMRDEHLKGESYFDANKYPLIHLVSTRINASNKKNTYTFFGKLTIKNTTREISFPFTADAAANGYLFKGSFKMNRKDFNIGGFSIISNELEVFINVLAK